MISYRSLIFVGFIYQYNDTRLFQNQTMIEFDLSNQTVYMKHMNDPKQGPGRYDDPVLRFDDSSVRTAIRLDAFLGCHQKYENENQLKGFYYNDDLETFFVFVNHFYLQITEDLVKRGFKDIFVGDYMKNAKPLEFESYEVAKSVLFDDLLARWVRIGGKAETQLILYDQAFTLSGNTSELMIKSRALEPGIQQCQLQTLVVKNKVFCFGEKYYSMMNEEALRMYEIRLMFAKTSVYNASQRMKFIFNYEENKVIFMTHTNFYVLHYSWFTFDQYDQTLTLNPTEELVERKNCLFVQCEEPTSTTTIPVPSSTPKPENNSFAWIKTCLIIVAVLLTLLIVSVFLFLQFSKNKDRYSSKESRDPEPELIKIDAFGEDKNEDKVDGKDDKIQTESESFSDKDKSKSRRSEKEKQDSKRNEMEEELVQIPNLNRMEPAN